MHTECSLTWYAQYGKIGTLSMVLRYHMSLILQSSQFDQTGCECSANGSIVLYIFRAHYQCGLVVLSYHPSSFGICFAIGPFTSPTISLVLYAQVKPQEWIDYRVLTNAPRSVPDTPKSARTHQFPKWRVPRTRTNLPRTHLWNAYSVTLGTVSGDVHASLIISRLLSDRQCPLLIKVI